MKLVPHNKASELWLGKTRAFPDLNLVWTGLDFGMVALTQTRIEPFDFNALIRLN